MPYPVTKPNGLAACLLQKRCLHESPYSLFMRTEEGGTWLFSICPLPNTVSQKLTPSLMDYTSQNTLCSDFLLQSSNGRQWPEVKG